MTRLLKPAHLFLGTLLIAASASSKATVEEYRWGTTVCTPTSSKVVRTSDGKMRTFLSATAASCRCEKNSTERRKVKVLVDTKYSIVTTFHTDENGKESLWQRFDNCKVQSSSDWDCSQMGQTVKAIRRMVGHEGLFLLATIYDEVGGDGSGDQIDWGACIRKDGWSLRGLIGK